MMNYDRNTGRYYDENTGIEGYSQTAVNAAIKRRKLQIPNHPFLSNKYVLRVL